MTGKIIKQGRNRSKSKSVPPTVTSCCLVAKLWPTLCNPTDHSPPGSSVHGILQARTLEWLAVSFSRASFWPRDWTCSSGGFFTMEPPGKPLSALITRLFSFLLTMGPKNISPLPVGMMSSSVRSGPQEEGIFSAGKCVFLGEASAEGACLQLRAPRPPGGSSTRAARRAPPSAAPPHDPSGRPPRLPRGPWPQGTSLPPWPVQWGLDPGSSPPPCLSLPDSGPQPRGRAPPVTALPVYSSLVSPQFLQLPLTGNNSLYSTLGSPDDAAIKNMPASTGDARDAGSIPGSGRSPGGGNGSPLRYPCLENPTGRGAWRALIPGVAESDMTEHTHTHTHTHTH